MSKAMKKARILSSESDASIKVKQVQDTNIDLSIAPPAQRVNFQPCAMAELATMAPPASLQKSTFNPILEETPQTRCPSGIYMYSDLMHPALIQPRAHTYTQMDGPLAQEYPQAIAKPSHSQEKESLKSDDKENPIKETVERSVEKAMVKEANLEEKDKQKIQNRTDSNGLPVLIGRDLSSMGLPKLRKAPPYIPPHPITETSQRTVIDETPKIINDISIIDELKRPEEMLPNQPSIKRSQEQEQERIRLQILFNEKTKRAEILESMLDVYENKHQTINGLLTCRQKQLEQLIHAYCGADKIELIFEPISCGCTGGSQKLIDIESILVTVNGKTVDFRYGFNDAYADMVRHGINLKQILA